MKDMTHKQLIRSTYVVAKFKDPETAKLLTELAGRLDCALVAARTACLDRDASVRAEIEWEKAMMQAVGEDGVGDVVQKIEKLKAGRDALESAQIDYELTRGQLLIAHRTLLNQQARIAELESGVDAEPARNPVLAYADSYRDMARQGVKSIPIWSVITDLERNIAPLCSRPQTAPVVPNGFVLVPLKPTKEMLQEAEYERGADWQYAVDIWDSMCRAAMLGAAPQQEVKP